ncbi:acyl-CoA synthetase (AMP-forming)/AMP-acid ligase II [Allocatelliglobosispora scoriae]|uniref:Acyl-CoA synthetase (AMP-forming)/AMP-acid ligase II n=1 Tax=Allocatelliglobosispora scoriae TaxID=643052 RepID=A0A841BTV7_9ACTN|nr:AMP-binding protein [Allocatelliglobosispora scoriae]MBB5870878.1 acyl-CoA synthetase (AMP-forming)/AMP-acid ligase II [Allocatelliglobosispora scoriae]
MLWVLAKRGLLTPGPPGKVAAQLNALRRWGFSLAGELRAAADRSPEKVAVIDESGSVTYRDLQIRVEALGLALRARHDIGLGSRIGVLGRNHSGTIVSMAAGVTLGAEVVLLNPALSAAAVAAVAREQGISLVLADTDLAELVAGLPTLTESAMDQLVRHAPPGRLDPPDRAGRLIVLTSGTTAAPKGARRRTPTSLAPLASVLDRIPLNVGDNVFIAAPLFHTWGLAGLQMCLALRATMVLRRRFDPVSTVVAMGRHGCAGLVAVPIMVQRLTEAVPHPTIRPRVVAVSGSALPGVLATRFMDAYGDCLYNLYGSTEASWVSIATPADLRLDPRTAGRPPLGTKVEIRAASGLPVAAGEIGEIFVRNGMLFEGYTFASPTQVAGMLGTGDLGHFDADGLLFVDGRADDMIISGGENVFPRPVEELIATLPQVREVAVIGVPDDDFGQRLAAYVVLHDDEQLSEDEVREYVRHYLARFCVPREVNFRASLPRTATGKVIPRDLE